MTKTLKSFIVVCVLFALLLVGCGEKEADHQGKPVVYASFYPVYDLIHQVAGDKVHLETFMPFNADPHLWEPTPKDMERLSHSDLLVVNGANMEKWLDQVRQSLPDLDVLVLADSIELITYKGAAAMGDFQYMAAQEGKKGQTYTVDIGHTHEDIMRICFMKKDSGSDWDTYIDRGKKNMKSKGKLVKQKETIQVEEDQVYSLEMGHESGAVYYELPEDGQWIFISDRISEDILPYELTDDKGQILDLDVYLTTSTAGFDKITYDPHSWISLNNAKAYLNAINMKLAEKFGHQRYFNKNKVAAVDRLTDLGVKYKEKFKEFDDREFVVTHYAYQYLANEFDLIQYPLQGLVSTETPSLKTIKKALDFCEYKGIHTIFYESGLTQKGADTLANELGGKTAPLNSMEYVKPGLEEEAGGYTAIMEENLERLYQSFKR